MKYSLYKMLKTISTSFNNINKYYELLLLLLLLSRFSRVRLFATPWTAAHQAPPSMGFSRLLNSYIKRHWKEVIRGYIL